MAEDGGGAPSPAADFINRVFQLARSGRLGLNDLLMVTERLAALGNQAMVVALYREWLAHGTAPTACFIEYNLGLALARLGVVDQAWPAFERALALSPSFELARQVLALREDGAAAALAGLPALTSGDIDALVKQSLAVQWPAVNAHVFNRLAPRVPASNNFFYFFPYGLLVRHLGVGPINEFGFRIQRDLAALEQRSADEVVIAFFGNSCTFSCFCRQDQMFTTLIEQRLNGLDETVRRGRRFTVLNFGQNSHVILNEILTWLLFCHRLRPDIVVSHGSVTDVIHGLTSDPYLLRQHDITYVGLLEGWSQALHVTGDVAMSQAAYNNPASPYRVLNDPPAVIRAYLSRLHQFRRLAEAQGSLFVTGLQPITASKAALAPAERAGVAAYEASEWREVMGLLAPTYDALSRELSEAAARDGGVLVDFHQAFKCHGADETLFADFVHMVAAGDRAIADIYVEAFVSRVLPALAERSGAAAPDS